MKKFYFYTLLLCFLLLGGIWIAVGTIAIEKIVTACLMPAGLVWLVLSLLLLELIRQRTRWMIAGVGLVWLGFTLAGNWHLAGYLAENRETDYAEISPFDQGRFDAIVILGGGVSEGANRRNQGNGAGDRLILAAQLYHRGQVGTLICTGKRIEAMDSSGTDQSEQFTGQFHAHETGLFPLAAMG